jgi:2-polyprenyl-3-methyl-5-hydroxy-6-metoxy-1,4-benzoquinol methylase
MNRTFWNERYQANETTYGIEPNDFFKSQLDQLTPGKLLLPAEGEGRNALYAARQGWQVTAYDFSEVARIKTLQQALDSNLLNLEYHVQDLSHIELPQNTFDVIGIVFVHLPESTRKHLHRACVQSLKRGGRLILEVFSKNQLQFNSGGPKDYDLLYSLEILQQDFSPLRMDLLEERLIQLSEGPFHSGPAHVVRMVATKDL